MIYALEVNIGYLSLNTPYQGDDHLLNTNIDLFDNWQLASRKKKLLPKVTWVMPVMGTGIDINSNDWSDIEFKVRTYRKIRIKKFFCENEGAPNIDLVPVIYLQFLMILKHKKMAWRC